MKTLVLVACVAGKADESLPAAQLYQSDWFRKARQVAELADCWRILSAAHGLVDPVQELQPYNATLKGASPAARFQWAQRVGIELQKLIDSEPQLQRVIVLAGRAYLDPLDDFLRKQFRAVICPLAGLGIGQQKAELIQLAKELKQ